MTAQACGAVASPSSLMKLRAGSYEGSSDAKYTGNANARMTPSTPRAPAKRPIRHPNNKKKTSVSLFSRANNS
ncbi:MAG: hypothetical protein ACK55I_19405, partial [bacterium]